MNFRYVMVYFQFETEPTMKKAALIMAGGSGERFWPKSRKILPKQFLSLTDNGKTMIQLTVERISSLVDMKDIFISTNANYRNLVIAQLPEIPAENILCEPVGRNTAPCIGLGAVHMAKRYGDALMIVLPSDHLIKYTKMFVKTLSEGCNIAERDSNLVTIGITPDCPETGYGYIKFTSEITYGQAYKVEHFVEKPDLQTAKEFLEAEEYLWNSGMFIWKVSTILKNIQNFMPDTYHGLNKIRNAIGKESQDSVLESVFPLFKSESIDYSIMENADNIYTIPGIFGWDDVGSWLAVERIRKTNECGNVVEGNIITIDCKNNIIQGKQKLIATVGIENLIIVDTEDAALICNKRCVGDIKKVLETLRKTGRDKYI